MKDLLIAIHNGGDEAVEAAKKLSTAGEWIPASERLPPDNKMVLVNHDGTGIEMATRQPNGQWVICWTGFEASGVAYTHWMPLPEPPEVTQ
jgi:hypothetical protein